MRDITDHGPYEEILVAYTLDSKVAWTETDPDEIQRYKDGEYITALIYTVSLYRLARKFELEDPAI